MNSETGSVQRKPLIYYGWYVLAVVFLSQMMTVGLMNYSFGLFVKPVSAEFGLSRADTNIGLMILSGGTALASPFVGRLLDRYPARYIICIGVTLFSAGLIAIAFTHSALAIAALLVFPVALTGPCGSHLMTSTVVSRWFTANRGRALGISALSGSLSGIVVVKVLSYLIELEGWRQALFLFGVVQALVIGGLAFLIVRDRPADVGVPMDGVEQTAEQRVAAEMLDQRDFTVRILLRTRDFWLIALSIGLLVSMDVALLGSLVPYGLDRGMSPDAASTLMAIVSGAALCGKLISGYLCDKVDKRWLLAGVVALNMLFMLTLASNPSPGIVMLISGTAGLSIGGTLPVWYSTVAQRFGTRRYGTTIGMIILVHMPFSLFMVRFAGEVFDRTGGYEIMFITFACLSVLALLLFLPVPLEPRRRGATTGKPRSGAGATSLQTTG